MIPQVWNNTIHLLDKPLLFNDQLVKITKCVDIIGQLLFLAIFASIVAFGIQNVALAHIPPAQASLFLSLESVFGVLFSVLLYGQQLSLRLLMGFSLIFVAIIISETFPLKRKQPDGAVGEAI